MHVGYPEDILNVKSSVTMEWITNGSDGVLSHWRRYEWWCWMSHLCHHITPLSGNVSPSIGTSLPSHTSRMALKQIHMCVCVWGGLSYLCSACSSEHWSIKYCVHYLQRHTTPMEDYWRGGGATPLSTLICCTEFGFSLYSTWMMFISANSASFIVLFDENIR